MQSAFSSGPLNVSLPAISAGEPVVGILLGVVVFGDRVQDTPGELAIYTGGLAALVAGVIMVGRSPALSQLRAWTEESIASLPTLPHVPAAARAEAARPDAAAQPTRPRRPARRRRRRAPTAPHPTTRRSRSIPPPRRLDSRRAPPGADDSAAPGHGPDLRGLAVFRSRRPRAG